MISKQTAAAVLEKALCDGADFSELYIEDTESNQIEMTDGTVKDAVSSRKHGAGIRVFSGVKSAYAYTADTSEKALLETARAAAAALECDGRTGTAAWQEKNYGSVPEMPIDSIDNTARIALMKKADAAARGYSSEITQAIIRIMEVDQRVTICNSEGVWAEDRRPRIRISVQAIASDGTGTQTGSESPGCSMGFEAFRERIDPEYCAVEAAKSAVTMLHAPECPAGYLPVIIDGGFGGVIFHEACGHSLEATSVSKGNSEFCGKLGQKIAADCVSAVDDGTLSGEWGHIGCDDEGTPSQRNLLIENGILKGYMIDKLGGRRMGMAPTGSSRRQGYNYAPTSRMTNTFILPGKDDPEEMIRATAEGLYARKMGGGSVNPLTGEFNFAVAEGYWIRNGAILTPVRGATLVGKGSEVLLRIDRVADKMWMAQGVCGSVSGQVPTNVGQPRIRVSEITIGGKGGAL
ncbi:MAG: TldD/PmbA family protein [Ruminococcaceae bacterium]|nr:TldD/PmbA family protein [Oscillospiraceae bacterium]